MQRIYIMDDDYEKIIRAASAMVEPIDSVVSLLVQDYLPRLLEDYDLDPEKVLS